MPFNLDIVGACENIRREAETLAGQNYAYNMKKKTGFLDFLTSQENGPAAEPSLISYDSGKKIATLKVLYDQRTKECQISDDCDLTVCDPGSTPQRKQALFNISQCIKTPVRSYSNDDMVALCMDTQTFIKKRAGSDLRAAVEFFSTKLAAEIDSHVGINYEFDGSTTAADTYKSIQLINSDAGEQPAPLPGNWATVMLDYENNGYNGTPAAIGQGLIQQFYKLHGYSCCNSTTPYGEADVEGDARFYLDQSGNSVLGTNNFVIVAPGVFKLITFNENRNININDDSVVHTVIPDPNGYGFDWNLDAYWDHCTKTWKVMYSVMWGLFNTFQADSFAASGEGDSPDSSPDCDDSRLGLTGVIGYTATAA